MANALKADFFRFAEVISRPVYLGQRAENLRAGVCPQDLLIFFNQKRIKQVHGIDLTLVFFIGQALFLAGALIKLIRADSRLIPGG